MNIKSREPKLFIISSSETLDVAEVLKENLREKSDVVLWTLNSIWKPGEFTLQGLLSEAPKYDFAIAVFGHDDIVESRGEKMSLPRDNVIFEAGMFMAHLGPERTFVVASEESNLKVLSDLAGLTILRYSIPDKKTGIQGAVKTVVKKLIGQIEKRGPVKPYVAARIGPELFIPGHMHVKWMLNRIARMGIRNIVVRNLALDMEVTWPFIRDHVLKPHGFDSIQWQSLMADHLSKTFEALSGPTISGEKAKRIEKDIRSYCSEHIREIEDHGVKFECRAYKCIPIIHGFSIENYALFLSLCYPGKKYIESIGYIEFPITPENVSEDNELAAEYLNAFSELFDKEWHCARHIWPEES